MAEDEPDLFQELKRRKVYRVAITYVIVAWIALQFFDLVLENVNAPDWIMQSVMAVLAVGFPVALVLSWIFEITKDGVRATSAGNRAFTVLIGVISIGAIGFAAWVILDRNAGEESQADQRVAEEFGVIDSIAVLPFESFSEDRSDEYFADGLADTLLHKLAQLPNLKVIARNSSFQYKGTNADAREIGRALEVGALLEGSVQRQGDDVRIIAQLIDTTNGAHIWSSTFDDTMQNIFDLQDRIASEIMLQLQISISEQDRRRVLRNGTNHPEAYDLLLRANESASGLDRRVFDPETDPKLALIDQALEIDPDYAQAWEARSARFSSALFFDNEPGKASDYIAAAMDAANRAIEANPGYAGGYTRLGAAHRRARNIADSESNLIRALELDPADVDALTNLGLLKVNDDPQLALDLFTRVRELDPQSVFVYRQLFFALDALGRLEEGVQTLLDGIERFPDEGILFSDLAGVYILDLGKPDEAARWASKIVAQDSQNIFGLGSMSAAWLAAGDVDRSRRWLDLYADRFAGSPDVVLRQHSLHLLTGDAEAARTVVESVPESPSFMFDRATPIGGACLVLGDSACLQEQASSMQRWLDAIEAMGQVYAPSERYERAAAILRNAAIANLNDRDIAGMTALLEEGAEWPITGGRGTRYAGYLRVMLQSLLENDEEAVRELHETLEFADDGFLYRDIFRLPPDLNPLITRLAGVPGYSAWLAALAGRRENTRGNLVRMEQNGEILSANDVEP